MQNDVNLWMMWNKVFFHIQLKIMTYDKHIIKHMFIQMDISEF